MGERALAKCASIVLITAIVDWSYTSATDVRHKTIMIIFNFFKFFHGILSVIAQQKKNKINIQMIQIY